MRTVSTEDFLELLGDLCSTPTTASVNLVEVLKECIENVYRKISTENKFEGFFEILTTTSPSLNNSCKILENVTGEVVSELYVEWILCILQLYSKSLFEEMEKYQSISGKITCSPDTLNPTQNKAFRCSIDFIFVLGVSPQLYPGVGLPLIIKSAASYNNIQKHFPHINSPNKNMNFLKKILDSMISLYECSTIFKEYITSHHFKGYLSALLQMAYCPHAKIKSDSENARTNGDVERYRRYVCNMINQLPGKFIVKELLCFVAKPSTTSSNEAPAIPPKWIISTCGIFLRDCIMKINGVKNFICSLAEECSDATLERPSDAINKPTNVDQIAVIIVSCPLLKYPRDKYYSNICTQILEAIREIYNGESSVTKSQNRKLMPAFVKILENLSTVRSSTFNENFLNLLLQPLVACCFRLHSEKDLKYEEIVCEKKFSSCIEMLHEIFVTFHTPSSPLLPHLIPYMDILFKLYLYSSSSISHLNSLIESLVTHIFSNIESSKAISLLRHFAGLEALESSSTPPPSTSPSSSSLCSPPSLSSSVKLEELLFMNDDLKFAPGDSGGIRVVMRENLDLCKNSLLKEIEQKVSCLLNIISSIKDQNVTINIFLFCLQRLTQTVCQEIESKSGDDDDLLRELSRRKSLEVEEWSNVVLLLTFLGCFVERFADLCMTNVEDIFAFCLTTMERTINILKKSKDSQIQHSPFEDLQNETLTLVTSLLATVALDNKQMSPEKWNQAEILVPSLRYLSNHHLSQEVRFISYELMEAIATHGKLISSKSDLKADKNLSSSLSSSNFPENDLHRKGSFGKLRKMDIHETSSNVNSTSLIVHQLSTSSLSEISQKSEKTPNNNEEKKNADKEIIQKSMPQTSPHRDDDNIRSSTSLVSASKPISSIFATKFSSQSEAEASSLTSRPTLSSKLTLVSENKKAKRVLIEEISTKKSYYDDINDLFKTYNQNLNESKKDDSLQENVTPRSAFQQALVEVTSYMEPIKGGGLLNLKKLIESADPEVKEHRKLVLKICMSCLLHEDSYVYLNAINALSSLASSYSDLVLPSVIDAYLEKFTNNAEIKLKLGEVLVKSVRNLGEMAMVHKNKLFSALLTVQRDEDETVRSSAISNLAEVCKLLSFSISSYIYEIFDAIRGILKYEKSIEVRRAAALFTTQVLQGTSKNTILILGDLLPEFYRLLKYLYSYDHDHVVKLHAQLSLEEMNGIMRNFLFPLPTFEKQIFILNPPPS